MRRPSLALFTLAVAVTTPLGAQTVQLVSSPPPELARSQNDPVVTAYRVFERTGYARMIDPEQAGGYVVFPFGHERAVVSCPRLNACLVMLQRGEMLTDQPLAGDTERWIIETSVMGSGQESPLIVVKPQDCDLSTNVLVPTTRRVYELGLVSDPCEDSGGIETYTRQVKFFDVHGNQFPQTRYEWPLVLRWSVSDLYEALESGRFEPALIQARNRAVHGAR